MRRLVAPALLLAVSLAAVGATAQTNSPPAGSPGMAAGAEVQQRIDELHTRLQITRAQEPAWQNFAQTMRDNAAHMDALFKARAEAGNASALDDLRSYAAIAQAHADDMQRLLPTFAAVYAVLSPAQKHAADVAFSDYENRHMSGENHS